MLDLDSFFHTIVVYCPRVCHDLYQGYIFKVKVTVHTKKKSVSDPLLLTIMLDVDYLLYNCIMTLTRDHIAKVKVTVYT